MTGKGHMEAERAALLALLTEQIVSTQTIEGSPGGPNNDCLELRLGSGRVVTVDAYSGGDIHVRLADREGGR